MPNRILREGILTSERVEQLDAPAEVFYRRLMSKVDDHGLYDARLSILRSSLYPLRVDRVREADISRWMAACQKAGVIALYQHDGKPYLQMLDTKWQTRSEAKYPIPIANNCLQEKSPAHLDGDVFEDVSEDDKAPRKRVAPPDGVSDSVWQDFQKTRRAKKAPVTDTAMDGIRREAQKAGITLEKALQTCCERGWTGFKAEWLTETKRASGLPDPTSTVPSKPGIDPALAKAIADAKLATKPPPEIVQRMKELTGART